MNAKHTPGPWVETTGNATDLRWVEAPGVDVAEVRSGNPADVRLIAAAPDLLAALDAVTTALSDLAAFRDKDGTLRIVNDSGDRIAYAGVVLDERAHAARAAIARATGGVN